MVKILSIFVAFLEKTNFKYQNSIDGSAIIQNMTIFLSQFKMLRFLKPNILFLFPRSHRYEKRPADSNLGMKGSPVGRTYFVMLTYFDLTINFGAKNKSAPCFFITIYLYVFPLNNLVLKPIFLISKVASIRQKASRQ